MVAVAQLARASACGAEGRGFKSPRPPKKEESPSGRWHRFAKPGPLTGHAGSNPASSAGRNGEWRRWLARTLWEREVAGSNPASPTKKYAVVAQLVEHLPSKEKVAGSIPVHRSKSS